MHVTLISVLVNKIKNRMVKFNAFNMISLIKNGDKTTALTYSKSQRENEINCVRVVIR